MTSRRRIGAAGSVAPILDCVALWTGRLAHRGLLYLMIAAGLGAARGRWSRRAALRGLGSVTVASATAEAAATCIALYHRLEPRTPVPHKVPGAAAANMCRTVDSAAAAAFAVGVSLELPGLALPMSALVTAATARAVADTHRRSCAVGGLIIGAAVGMATLRWWPRRPMQPAAAVRPRREAPMLEKGDGLVLVVNPAAGGVSRRLVEWLRAELPKARLVEPAKGENLAAVLRSASRYAQVLGAAGGDGTVAAVANIALDARLPLLVIPAGTLNHFAADLGVMSARDAVLALRAGDSVLVDVGVANGQPFLNTSSTGVYVDLVRVRKRLEPTLGKRPAGLVALAHVLRRGRPLDLIVDGRQRSLWLLFGGNCCYAPPGLAPAYRPHLADGLLDVRLIDAERRLARSRLLAAVMTGTLRRSRVYETWNARKLDVAAESAALAGLALDGEIVDAGSRIRIEKRPRQLLVYRLAGG